MSADTKTDWGAFGGFIVVGLIILGLWSGLRWVVESFNSDPQFITADGESYVACEGSHVTTDGTFLGEQVYEVTFKQPQVGDTTLRGIHKVTVIDAPKDVCTTQIPAKAPSTTP